MKQCFVTFLLATEKTGNDDAALCPTDECEATFRIRIIAPGAEPFDLQVKCFILIGILIPNVYLSMILRRVPEFLVVLRDMRKF